MEVEEEFDARCSWSALQKLKDEASICRGGGGVVNGAQIRGALERIKIRSSRGLSTSAANELVSIWLDIRLCELKCCFFYVDIEKLSS